MLWLGLLALGTIIVLWRAGLAWLLARMLNPFLLLFVALAVASVAWSIDPALSARRLIRMGTIVLVCVAFVLIGWHARRFQNVVRPDPYHRTAGLDCVRSRLSLARDPSTDRAELVGRMARDSRITRMVSVPYPALR